jgi:hypothetical protein
MEPEGSLLCSQEPSTGPYPETDQSSPYHPIPSHLRSILILFTNLRLGLPSGLFPSFPQIFYMDSSFRHSCYMLCPSHSPWLGHSNYTWRRVQVVKLLIMLFSPTTCLDHWQLMVMIWTNDRNSRDIFCSVEGKWEGILKYFTRKIVRSGSCLPHLCCSVGPVRCITDSSVALVLLVKVHSLVAFISKLSLEISAWNILTLQGILLIIPTVLKFRSE